MKHFLIIGRTGVGKSSVINSTFGATLAKTDSDEACTGTVDYYAQHTEYGEICLIDTPGLAEADDLLDARYLDEIQKRIADVTLEAVIYVTPLKETRFPAEEQDALVKITARLGRAIWASSWLMFTFASSVPVDQRQKRLDHRVRDFDSLLRRIASSNQARRGYFGFRKIIMVDNEVANWSPNCKPLVSFME